MDERQNETWSNERMPMEEDMTMAENTELGPSDEDEGGQQVLPLDCIGIGMLICVLIVDDELLRRIECMINIRMKWIICRRCETVIPLEYLQTHVCKHKLKCSDATMQSIMSAHMVNSLNSIMEYREENWVLDTPIAGIPVNVKGYKCLKCRYYAPWRTMTEHFRLQHQGHDAKDNTRDEQSMQAPFGGRLKKWFGLIERSEIEAGDKNEDTWNAVEILLAKKKRTKCMTKTEDNVRLVTGFLARTRWDILIEGQDTKKLIALAVSPKTKDPFDRIVKMAYKYFEGISDKLRVGNVLLRRKIESTGYSGAPTCD